MKESIRDKLQRGPFPFDDGWGWLYRGVDRIAPPETTARTILCRYFFPTAVEWWGQGRIYRLLGVHRFGSVLPTGGIVIRRITKARMEPYTLAGTSLGAARAFYYRTCVFESLHLPFPYRHAGSDIPSGRRGPLGSGFGEHPHQSRLERLPHHASSAHPHQDRVVGPAESPADLVSSRNIT